MLRNQAAWLLTCLGMSLLTSSAMGQTVPAHPPITCEIKDNVEDAACQDKLKELFSRQGDTLTLKLDGGKSKTYVGDRAACENADTSKCVVFNLLSYFPQTQSYLVSQAYYECGPYLFINRHTGSETLMYAIPVLSPNARYLLSIDQSDACDRKYDIAIWSMQTDSPKLEFSYQAKLYENWDVTAWKDDTHIRMKAFINDKTPYDQEAELVRNAGNWALQLGKKTVRRQ